MPSEPTRIRMRAWLIRSADTVALIVVSDACSAIGPKRSWRALTIWPPRPSVGSWVLPVAIGGDGEADGDPDDAADGLAEPAELGLGAGDALGAAARRPISSVLMSMKPLFCFTTIACRPFSWKTEATSSGPMLGSANRICQ